MMESMKLFDSICNNKWFVETSIILFLNKKVNYLIFELPTVDQTLIPIVLILLFWNMLRAKGNCSG